MVVVYLELVLIQVGQVGSVQLSVKKKRRRGVSTRIGEMWLLFWEVKVKAASSLG
jgi:hypothetical protein